MPLQKAANLTEPCLSVSTAKLTTHFSCGLHVATYPVEKVRARKRHACDARLILPVGAIAFSSLARNRLE
jgi:hypothetical protein